MKVAWLHVAPVKGLRIEERESVELGLHGVDDDRRFCVVDETGRLLNGKRLAPLTTIAARFDMQTSHLHLRMPNGSSVGGTVAVGEPITVPAGNVGRCVVTTRDPETAEPSLDTLELLARYRTGVTTTEPLAFGVWAHVERAGSVRLGDVVEVDP